MFRKNGLTLVELLMVLVILGVIAGIGVFLIGNSISSARLAADQATVRNLNTAVSYYLLGETDTEAFFTAQDDTERITVLYETGYLSAMPVIQNPDGNLVFDPSEIVWHLEIDDEPLPLSPFGDSFEEISAAFIELIHDHYVETGSYGRTWGDYRYTDLGLDPLDWVSPILHIYYTPSGSTLKIRPESGYEFLVYSNEDELIVLPSTRNYSLIYSDIDELWYYYSIAPENVIDITTLEVQLTV